MTTVDPAAVVAQRPGLSSVSTEQGLKLLVMGRNLHIDKSARYGYH
jgi:hypothetical protein